MKKFAWGLFLLILLPFGSSLHAEEVIVAKITVIIASNNGNDFNLENDAYRDQLIKLFSYTSYKQVKEYSLKLEKVKQEVLVIPGDYEFVLTFRGRERGRTLIGALIQKGDRKFLNTDLAISGNGPVFLGGPPVDSGVLLLVIETLP